MSATNEQPSGHLIDYKENYTDMRSAGRKAIFSAIGKLQQQVYEICLTECEETGEYVPNEFFDSGTYSYLQDLKRKVGTLPSTKATKDEGWKDSKYILLTVNPPPNVTFEAFVATIEMLLSSKLYENAIWAYEQRSPDMEGMGRGFHCHIMFNRVAAGDRQFHGRNPAEYKKHAKCLNTMFGGQPTFSQLNWKRVTPGTEYKTAKYVVGDKSSPEKFDKCAVDIEWRKSLGLLPVYPSCEKLYSMFPDLQSEESEDLFVSTGEPEDAGQDDPEEF